MLLKIRVAKILQGFVTSQLTEYTPPPYSGCQWSTHLNTHARFTF